MDNIFVERLWRPRKYEEVYLKNHAIERYFRFYNHERHHQSLEYRTPAAIYQGRA